MTTLYQLAISHYNEKARWALELKGVDHERVTLMPGFHRISVRRMGGTTTPILKVPDRPEPLLESTQILEYLDEAYPKPRLFPVDPAERQEVDELVRFLDKVAGTSVRAYLYWLVIQQRGALYERWAEGLRPGQRAALRLAMPMMTPMLVRAFGLTKDRAPKHLAGVWRSCDRVESRLKETGDGYLVGGRFSAADLTAACLLGPAAGPAGSPWDASVQDTKANPALEEFRQEFAERPAAAWVRQVWQAHRWPGEGRPG